MSHICYLCAQWKSDNIASLAQHIQSCRKLMANKNTITTCMYNMQYDIAKNDIAKDECNETTSNHNAEDFDDKIDHHEDHHDNNSILSAPLDDNSIEPMNDMDTTTFLDTILNNHLMDYLNYARVNRRRSDNISDIMIAAIELLTILKNAKASLALYNKIIDWVIHCKASIPNKHLPAREKVLVIAMICHA